MPEPTPTPFARLRAPSHLLAIGLLLAITILGAAQLAFLCDDAYITFRYVANAHAGHGLVWNPPPFQPVEGYTGFLWAMLLWAAWSWLGVEPPAAANVLSILCGVGLFAVVARAALRLRWRDGSPVPGVVGLCALAVIVGNRSFLQWMTSGLETALFNLAFVAWVLLAFRGRRDGPWLFGWASAAAVAALTRPDGLLFVAATAAVAAWRVVRRQARWSGALLALSPLLVVLAHVAWRRSFYGEWLPNTYYAKVTGAWPEAGLRYFGCFALEHGVWLWVPLCLLWLAVELARGPRAAAGRLRANLPAVAAVAAVIFHFAYYTLAVGGDHFEYRVYSHLVPLGGLAAAAMAVRLCRSRWVAVTALALLGLAGSVGWLHLWLTREMPSYGFRTVAPQLPEFAQPVARWFDRQQAWLRFRLIGLRCNFHALFLAREHDTFPRRMPIVGATDPFPAFATGAVGLVGWSLPDAVIVDVHGLNDWVVARTPVRPLPAWPTREQFRLLIASQDRDQDGFLDATELRQAVRAFAPGDDEVEGVEYMASILMAIYARQRPDALAAAESETIGESLAGARAMAHERSPPPGYVEELQPNVAVADGVATATARRTPLTTPAVEAFEAAWRDRVRRGLLEPR